MLELPSLLLLLSVGQASAGTSRGWLEEIAHLEARIEVLEKRRALNDLVEARAADRAARLPLVLAVSGRASDRRALLRYPTGRMGRHRVGDELLPGVVVLAIEPRGVRVTTPRGAPVTAATRAPANGEPEQWLDFAAMELPARLDELTQPGVPRAAPAPTAP